MIFEPPLLIIADIPAGFDLMQLSWPAEAQDRISINPAKFSDVEMAEIVIDGLTFCLARFAAAETVQRSGTGRFEHLFCGPPSPDDSAIGIGMRDVVSSARHLPMANHRLLQLGKWIGESLAAAAAAWLPSGKLASFAYFQEVTNLYLAGGPFPGLFQTSFVEDGEGVIRTAGLSYFSGQEVRLTAPTHYSRTDVTNRLVRLIDDLATNGRIETPSRSRGMVDSERLTFLPSKDLSLVDIIIEDDAPCAVPIMI